MEPPGFSEAAMLELDQHAWPGNVRELRNAIERALLLSGGQDILPEHLALQRGAVAAREAADAGGTMFPFPATMTEVEKAAARATVDWFGGNKTKAARRLGIARSHLYRLLED